VEASGTKDAAGAEETMRLIRVGCEYAGKTTLALGVAAGVERTRLAEYGRTRLLAQRALRSDG
jgi:nicotinamide riboside kinase